MLKCEFNKILHVEVIEIVFNIDSKIYLNIRSVYIYNTYEYFTGIVQV